jgi:hypothetical protein
LLFAVAADPPGSFREHTMQSLRSKTSSTRMRRWAPLVAAAGILALLSGCVVYPVGYYGGGYGGGYGHGHYDYR